jgi:hypothetical protein
MEKYITFLLYAVVFVLILSSSYTIFGRIYHYIFKGEKYYSKVTGFKKKDIEFNVEGVLLNSENENIVIADKVSYPYMYRIGEVISVVKYKNKFYSLNIFMGFWRTVLLNLYIIVASLFCLYFYFENYNASISKTILAIKIISFILLVPISIYLIIKSQEKMHFWKRRSYKEGKVVGCENVNDYEGFKSKYPIVKFEHNSQFIVTMVIQSSAKKIGENVKLCFDRELPEFVFIQSRLSFFIDVIFLLGCEVFLMSILMWT